ncbi:hypothetical protein KM043_013195 [Ampulex compressa]|nr:hypothetical protein KM043_013195 [Ampulex compressa]
MVVYASQRNGIAKGLNQMLVEMLKSMLIDVDLPKEFWTSALDVETPYINGDLEEAIHMEQPRGFQDDTERILPLICWLPRMRYLTTCYLSLPIPFVQRYNWNKIDSKHKTQHRLFVSVNTFWTSYGFWDNSSYYFGITEAKSASTFMKSKAKMSKEMKPRTV